MVRPRMRARRQICVCVLRSHFGRRARRCAWALERAQGRETELNRLIVQGRLLRQHFPFV